ncbi:MAG TPA: hypothetical protein VGD94_04175 [Vicinamibacterales bacterium]
MAHETRGRQTRHGLWVAAFTLLAAAAAAAVPVADSFKATSTSSVRALISDSNLHQYKALRRMHAASERFDHEGWMDAWTELDSRGFRYRIVSERGSDTIRNRVLRTLLKREQELIANGDFGRGELTPENYEFGAESSGPDGVRYVLIKPKRKDSMLIDGRIVLSPEGDLLRVEGLLAKNPSFWTSQVHVTRYYSRVDGVRVPIATESIAKVKLAGRSRLKVEYEYESVNGRPVGTVASAVQ